MNRLEQMVLTTIGSAVFLLLLLVASSSALAEERICLNGVWDFEPQQVYKTPEKFSTKIIVPSFWNHPESFNYPLTWKTLPAGWFRRTVDIPKEWQGQRIALRFEGIYMTGQIFFNGQHIANTWDAINPNTVDVTPFVKWGEANEIRVGVREAIAESDDLFKPFDPSKVGQNFVPGGTESAKALALVPYGSQRTPEYRQDGLSRDVWMIRSEMVYVENVFIQTSVRKHEIVLDYEIRNTSDKPQKVVVYANVTPWKKDNVVLDLAGATVELAPGETKKVQLKKAWANADPWDPDHPNLYMLHTTIREKSGAFTDKSEQRFGFRESWVQGRNIYLNGNVVHLRGDSLMVHGSTQLFEDDAFREMCRTYRKFNINAFRFHCHCGSLRMFEIMDEEGVMAISESALHGSCGDQALEDERFWKNGQEHLRRQVRTERNYPSIVAYSVENEMGAFVQQKQPVRWDRLTALTRVVKENDPTRIAWHDGFAYGFMDAAKGTSAESDVEVLHYTGPEYWALYYNFPESSFWAKTMLQGKDFGGQPLALGEYAMIGGDTLWETNGTCHKPAHQAPWIGSRVSHWPDGNVRWYWDIHWLDLAFSIRGNRYSGLAAINPFTILQHYLAQSGGRWDDVHVTNRQFDWTKPGIKFPVIHAGRAPLLDLYNKNRAPYKTLDMIVPVIQANHQLLSFPRQLGTHFWGGGKLSRTFITFNDLYRPSKTRLSVAVTDEAGKVLAEYKTRLDIEVGGQREVPVTLDLPAVKGVTSAKLCVRHVAEANASVKYEETYAIKIYPPIALGDVFLFDPAGKTGPKLTEAGIAVKPVAALSALPAEAKHVVIGEDCLPQVTKADLDTLVKFAKGGGTVVVLSQDNSKDAYKAAWGNWAELEGRVPPCAYNLKPGPIPTTIAHLPDQKDALTADLTSDDVRFWAKDGAVAVHGTMPGNTPGVKSLVYCNRTELDSKRDLLLRVTIEKGQFYLCQLLLPDNVGPEPIARLLLARMLNPAMMPATAPSTAPAEIEKKAK